MSFKHRVYRESDDLRHLAALASATAAQQMGLNFTPAVNFFVEDERGGYERKGRVAGFIDRLSHAVDLDVFVRAELGLAKTVEVVFHEVCHIYDAVNQTRWDHDDAELRAAAFARTAPDASGYASLIAELTAMFQPLGLGEYKQREVLRENREWYAEITEQRRAARLKG